MYQARILLGWLCYAREVEKQFRWFGFCFVRLSFTVSRFFFAFTITHMCMGLIYGAYLSLFFYVLLLVCLIQYFKNTYE